MRRAVLLDRDGVINPMIYHAEFGLIDSPSRPEEFELLPGTAQAIKRIHSLGYLAIVISNQPGVAKGKYTLDLLEATKAKMHEELARQGAAVDAVYYCLHHPEAALAEYRQVCACRKPRPGMLLQAAADFDLDLSRSYFIGDGITDIQAGRQAGCKTILVNGRKCYLCDELARRKVSPDYLAKDLPDALEAIKGLQAGDLSTQAQYEFSCRVMCDE